MERVLGLIVAGGDSLLDGLGIDVDAALTPFAGTYRFLDFALATLANSGVTTVYVAAPGPAPALRAHLLHVGRPLAPARRPHLLVLPGGVAGDCGRATRLGHALEMSRTLAARHGADSVALLVADHILKLDLRQLLAKHRDHQADVTVAALPVPLAETDGRTVLRVANDGRVREVRERASPPPPAPDSSAFALAWAGDLVLRTSTPPTLLAGTRPARTSDVGEVLAPLVGPLRVVAYDVLDQPAAERAPTTGPYWHDPTTVEAYYEGQMDLCTPRPAIDLFDPAWPLTSVPSGLGPAKVVADRAGRAGQALNTIVADGSLICGAAVINTVVGHGVTVESGAEVIDSVLLDGCRVGHNARIRRAVVGAGAVVGDGESIGYEATPAGPARVLRSGLTLVPAV